MGSVASPPRGKRDSDDPSAPSKFLEHSKIIRRQLKYHNRYTVDPRHAQWVQYFDSLLMLAMIYTAFITPVEVSLLDNRAGANSFEKSVIFYCNQGITMIFAVDLVLNFFQAYQEPPSKGSKWVTNGRQIRKHYVRTWFALDFITTLPLDVVARYAGSDPTTSTLRLNRLLRLAKLIKYSRQLRDSGTAAQWQDYFSLSYAQVSMIKFFSATFFMVHLMACGWAAVGLTWQPTQGLTLEWEESWLKAYQFEDVSTNRLYSISLYVAVVAMFGGVGSIVPRNYSEYVYYTAMMLFGASVWAWVIGSLCGILATLNPHATAFQNQLDELNYFMRERNFPEVHRRRLRDFFRHTQDFSRLASYDKLMVKMSVQLRGDTALKIGLATLSKVSYFSIDDVEKEFLAVVALNLNAAIYEAREMLPTVDLTVIMKGMAARRLYIYSKGAVLGTQCLIPDERSFSSGLIKPIVVGNLLRNDEIANCLTFVQTSHISRSSLFTIVEHFPVAKAHLTRYAARYTLQAAFRMEYKRWKEEQKRGVGDSAIGRARNARASVRQAGMTHSAYEHRGHGHGPHGSTFQEILSAIEKAKQEDRPDAISFARKKHTLQRRAGFGSVALPGIHGDVYDSGGGGAGGVGLQEALDKLSKAQEQEARRSADLLARSESLELKTGVLDQKIELILQLLRKETEGWRAAEAREAEARAPQSGEKVTASGQVLHKRRKRPQVVRGAISAMHLARQGQQSATALPGQPPGGDAAAALAHMVSSAAAQRAERAREQQEEREEMREAMGDMDA